jgi:hypothetical protein
MTPFGQIVGPEWRAFAFCTRDFEGKSDDQNKMNALFSS